MTDTQTTTHPDNSTTPPDLKTRNFRLAFAIVGLFIAEGDTQINFNDQAWGDKIKLRVWSVAALLNELT